MGKDRKRDLVEALQMDDDEAIGFVPVRFEAQVPQLRNRSVHTTREAAVAARVACPILDSRCG